MELQGYLLILRARVGVVALITFTALLLATVYTFAATPKYVARSSVFLSAGIGETSGELSRSFPFAQGLVRSYSQIATQPVVLDPVIAHLGLHTTAGKLARSITAQAPLDTVIIDIDVVDSSAQQAADIADAVAAQMSSQVQSLIPAASQSRLPVSVTLLAHAEVPTYASSPRKSLNLGLGLILGFLLGVVLAIALDALDARVRGPRDATMLTRVPVIGSVVPSGRPTRRLRLPSRLRRRHQTPRERAVQLRTNFQFMRQQKSLKSVVFASALLDGATSHTVSNLATTLGETGLAVLIVDADMRRPTLADRHGLTDNLGLTSVLVGDTPVRSAIQRSNTGPVWVLPAGPSLHDPSRMLDDTSMRKLLEQVTGLFDVVLIKAPPVLAVAEGLTLARVSDGVVVVADEHTMKRDVLGEEMRTFEIAGAQVLGMVLTRSS